MNSTAWFIGIIVVLSGPTCGGDPESGRDRVVPGGPAAPGDPGASSVMRAITTPEGEFLCDESGGYVLSCWDPDTKEPWTCKVLPDGEGGITYECVPDTTGEPRTPPCDHFFVMGDGRSGLQCWDPPANYCKDGGTAFTAWYCKPDGSRCCLSPMSDCFRCGWVRMSDCTVAGGGTLDPRTCSNLFQSLSLRDAACVKGADASADCARADPDCDFDVDLVICP